MNLLDKDEDEAVALKLVALLDAILLDDADIYMRHVALAREKKALPFDHNYFWHRTENGKTHVGLVLYDSDKIREAVAAKCMQGLVSFVRNGHPAWICSVDELVEILHSTPVKWYETHCETFDVSNVHAAVVRCREYFRTAACPVLAHESPCATDDGLDDQLLRDIAQLERDGVFRDS